MKSLLASCFALAATFVTGQSSPDVPKPGLPGIQAAFSSLKPSATFKIGNDADWVLITDDSVWVTSSDPPSVHRIDPKTNKEVAVVKMPGEPCAGLAWGFGSVWVPLCGQTNSLVRVDPASAAIVATLPFGPAAAEGGIAASSDSIWIVTDRNGTLTRIDPATSSVRQRISIAPGSYVPVYDAGLVWVSGTDTNVVTAVDAASGKVLASVPVGPQPRFLTTGNGSIWTLNQGDGSVTRVDTQSKKAIATIPLGIPGHGGDIAWGEGTVWATVFKVPLTAVDAKTNRPLRQWVGPGGDALRYGHGSIWITNNRAGLLLRIPYNETVQH